jgi:ankyrin repeat protein
MGQELVARGGANVDACTNRNISHAYFQSYIYADYPPPGTPLLWAVRRNRPDIVSFLLSVGADPQKEFRMPTPNTPLAWAAVMHHTTCLQRIISHLEARTKHTRGKSPQDIAYGPLICCAINAADKFSIIIRNSSFYLIQLEATLRLLQEKTKNRHLNVAGDYETPLGYAVSEAHDEAAEIILKIAWGIEDINTPHNLDGRTPLLDAVHWNRRHMVRILLDHGADALAFAVDSFDQAKRNWSALHVFAE